MNLHLNGSKLMEFKLMKFLSSSSNNSETQKMALMSHGALCVPMGRSNEFIRGMSVEQWMLAMIDNDIAQAL